MKNFLKYVAALAIVGAFFVACSDWTDPEREITQHPDQQSPILRDNAPVVQCYCNTFAVPLQKVCSSLQ